MNINKHKQKKNDVLLKFQKNTLKNIYKLNMRKKHLKTSLSYFFGL